MLNVDPDTICLCGFDEIAWTMWDARDWSLRVGLRVNGAVVPVTFRPSFDRCYTSSWDFVEEVSRCIDAERAMLVGSF